MIFYYIHHFKSTAKPDDINNNRSLYIIKLCSFVWEKLSYHCCVEQLPIILYCQPLLNVLATPEEDSSSESKYRVV